MATLSQRPINIVTTGIEEEVFRTGWNIRRFLTVKQCERLVEDQKFEFDTKGKNGFMSQWQIGLKVVTEHSRKTVRMYAKLLNKIGGPHRLQTKCLLEYMNRSGSYNPVGLVKNAVGVNEELQINTDWIMETDWSNVTAGLDANGTLQLQIKLTILVPHVAPTSTTDLDQEMFQRKAIEELRKGQAYLLQDETSFDVKIRCADGEEFGAHKMILAAQNPVFASMFRAELTETQSGMINVEDISGKTMEIIRYFLYTGELLPSWRDSNTIVEFMYAAGKYQLTNVLEMLDNTLGKEEILPCNTNVLSMAIKLSLKKAETQLSARIVRLANAALNPTQLVTMFGGEN